MRHFALRAATIIAVLMPVCAFAWVKLAPIHPAVQFGGAVWIPVHAGEPWIPHEVSLALQSPAPSAEPGPLSWRKTADGFEIGELPVMAKGEEVDRIFLARIDPHRFRFSVLNAPAGNRNLDDWMRKTGAALIVNGSYYSHTGVPATPVVSERVPLGPTDYEANQGAFVSDDGETRIHDLNSESWRDAFHGASSAMVSYPLLLGGHDPSRTPKPSQWLANRSFVAQDAQGRIVIGTTKSAFFSLDRLSTFLKSAPLGLTIALNLDGGPVACQGVSIGGVTRKTYGEWELQVNDKGAWMLPHFRFSAAPMPIVLAVFAK